MEESQDMDSAVASMIMTPYVIMLGMKASFKDVIGTLAENKISAVFVHNIKENAYYVVTSGAIVDFLNISNFMEGVLADIPITSIMRGPIETLDIDTPVDKVIRFMNRRRYKRVLITKDGTPAGVISTRDVMKWNDLYFKPAKPQILLFMDNFTGNFIARHFFDENIDDTVQDELIDLYGGVLQSLSIITDEIIEKSGEMRHVVKDNRSILFEQYKGITGILISDYNSIDLNRKLDLATLRFYDLHGERIEFFHKKNMGVVESFNIKDVAAIFYLK
ncbi:MAG: CBS domain-containing protein [Promethearchaeota archaeon]